MPSWRLRNLLNVRLLAGVLCLTGIGMAAGVGPTGPALQSESQPDEDYEIVRMSKPDGTVVEMRVPRHRSLSAKRPATAKGTLRRLPGTADAGEAPSVTPQIGGHRVARRPQGATPRASSEGPVRRERPSSGRVVTQRANTGTRISHPYTGSRQLTSDAVDLMRPTAVTRGAVSATPVVASDNASEWRTGLGWVPHNEDDDTGRYLSEDDAFAELEPGDGWDGPTDDPDPVGDNSMPGWDAKAIARWDVVPYQTITEDFHIGVVAFHINGIDRVDFSVNNGPWNSVPRMQLNPRTNVWEYTVLIRPEVFEDGLIEVRAIVWPEGAGVPRVLAGPIENSLDFRNGNHSMVLTTNAGGTLPSPEAWADAVNGSDETGVVGDPEKPFRTPFRALYMITQAYGSSDGATVYLQPGDYTWGREEYMTSPITSTRWATLTSAAGVSKELVRFATYTSGGFRTRLLCASDVSFDSSISLATSGNDSCVWVNQGLFDGGSSFWSGSWYWGIYVTDTSFLDVGHAVVSPSLARGITINGIDNDAFPGGLFIVNSTVQGQNAEGTSNHADVWQARAEYEENILLYGLAVSNAREQGFFTRGNRHRDVAIVNCSLNLEGYPRQNQFIAPFQHLVLSHNTFAGSPFLIGVSDSSNDYGYYGSRNAIWSNNIFQWVSLSDPQSFSGSTDPDEGDLEGTLFMSNHYFNAWPDYTDYGGQPIGTPYGEDATEGPTPPSDRGSYGTGTPPWVLDAPR
ncbi:MAG: hypothetical protein ACF8R9_05195 [Phycisphaerales bacterium JB054]